MTPAQRRRPADTPPLHNPRLPRHIIITVTGRNPPEADISDFTTLEACAVLQILVQHLQQRIADEEPVLRADGVRFAPLPADHYESEE